MRRTEGPKAVFPEASLWRGGAAAPSRRRRGTAALQAPSKLFVFSVSCDFIEDSLDKNRNHHHTAIVMNDLSHIGRPGKRRSAALRASAKIYTIAYLCYERGEGGRKSFRARGSAQLIEYARFGKGNPMKAGRFPLIVFEPAWPSLA
jgi:hypothetical protein